MQINKKSAMTLAEVLLVLVLIGVVSALTIPGMRKHTQLVENGANAKKLYFTLNLALDRAIAEELKPIDDWKCVTKSEAKDSTPSSISVNHQCFMEKYLVKHLNTLSVNGSSIQLADGTAIYTPASGAQLILLTEPNANVEGFNQFNFSLNKFDSNCEPDVNGQWKFCPPSHSSASKDKTRLLMENDWKIKTF